MPPERAILLHCARVGPGKGDIGNILEQGIDWEGLLSMALRHGMMPLLYRHLKDCPEAVPAPFLEKLRGLFHRNLARNLLLTEELLRLLDLLQRHGIPALPYKGPALAIQAYGNLAFRQFGDLDILVPREGIPRAKALLVSQGYSPQFPLSERQEAYLLSRRHNVEFAFMHRQRGVHVDLHWQVAPPYMLRLDEGLWRQPHRVSLAGASLPAFPPETLFHVLCVHGSKHFWERLGWLCDIAHLATRDLDWGNLMAQSETAGGRRMLLLGLGLMEALTGPRLPEAVKAAIAAEPALKPLIKQVKRQIFSDGGNGAFFQFANLRRMMKMLDGPGERWQHLSFVLGDLQPSDFTFLSLPPGWFPLYHGLRPLRLAGKYGLKILGKR